MKIKDGFVLKEIAGSYVVVPVGEELVDLSAMITVNETGAFLWSLLENDVDTDYMCEQVLKEYEGAPADEVRSDISDFVGVLKARGILE